MIIQECGVSIPINIITFTVLRRWGFKQKVPRKVHVNTAASKEDKNDFKKRSPRYLWTDKINNKIKKTDLR